MAFTRKNVWDLGGDWADPILWYARGVKAMKARALADTTGWRFYGAIHGIDQPLWKQLGYLSAADKMPAPADVKRYWDECQHGTWYFLPWHRGYLLAFEANIRAEVVALKGPADWALPYWNYFKAHENKLPPAFASKDWPDGKGDNPLFVPQRYGPKNNGVVTLPMNAIDLKALNDDEFTGTDDGIPPAFGGPDTGFNHPGQQFGGLESQPHNVVHGLVGGHAPGNPNSPGLMSDPDTAGLDPIFWLHHANIDRLWEVWRQNPKHLNPIDANWLKGPANVGQRAFSLPMPGGKPFDYTPADMVDISKLGYTYDDLHPAAAASAQLQSRLLNLGASAAIASTAKGAAMDAGNKELVGASLAATPIQDGEAQVTVHLDPEKRRLVGANLAQAATSGEPDRVFLKLENVRGQTDGHVMQVYVGPSNGPNPASDPSKLAGTISLFGARKASLADGPHGGQGLNFVLDISEIVDALHLSNNLDVDTLDVRIVPLNPVPAESQVTVGRVSIVRHGR